MPTPPPATHRSPATPAAVFPVSNVGQLAGRAALRWPDKRGLIFDEGGEALTFGDIERCSNQMANALAKLGIGHGDRVALMLKNRVEFPLAWLALAKLGAVAVPINTFNQHLDTQYLLADSQACAVVTSLEFVPLLRAAARETPLRMVLCIDGGDVAAAAPGTEAGRAGGAGWEGDAGRGGDAGPGGDPEVPVLFLSPRVQDASVAAPDRPVSPGDVANIQFTSGTTGKPKGCMLSHGYWMRIAVGKMTTTPQVGADDVLITAQPFYYMDPVWNFVLSLMSGASLVVLDRFHPSTFWEKVWQYRASVFYCLGVMPKLLLKMPPGAHDRQHSVRLVICSGIAAGIHAALEERWGVPWIESYGSTECGMVTMEDMALHADNIARGCMGSPVPGRHIRIVDPDGNAVAAGEPGVLHISGEDMMLGYYRNEAATRAAVVDGWFDSGDVVRRDAAGQLYFVGRTKDMIRRAGENISAVEVEEALGAHPEVKHAACVGVADELRGEEIMAFVVLYPGATAITTPPAALVEFCQARIAYYKVPRYWFYIDALPMTASEKIAKKALLPDRNKLPAGTYDQVKARWLE